MNTRWKTSDEMHLSEHRNVTFFVQTFCDLFTILSKLFPFVLQLSVARSLENVLSEIRKLMELINPNYSDD